MAAYKFTVKRGATSPAQIAVAAGSAEAQSDTLSINIDVTAMSRGDVIHMLEKAKQKILAEPWPPLA